MVRPNKQYAPYMYMKRIDEVNYSLSEQLAVTRRLGTRLLNVSSGVSYYHAPDILLEEIARAIGYPAFCQQYDDPEGSPVGRHAVRCYEHFLSHHRLDLSYENVLITHGATMAMHVLSSYFADKCPNGEILVPVPTFALAGSAMTYAGLRAREVFHTDNKRFLPTLQDYQTAQSRHTRLLYLNIFNNPTGECYDGQELAEIVQWAKASDITIIVDKVSADLISDVDVPNILDIAYEQDCLDNIIIVSSISKDRSLPGLRAGWVIGPVWLIAALTKYSGRIAMAPSSLVAVPIFVDMLSRTLRYWADRSIDVTPSIMSIANAFVEPVSAFAPLTPDVADFMAPYTDPGYLQVMVEQYRAWYSGFMDLLWRNWLLIKDTYSNDFVIGADWQGGFNTFVRVPVIDHADPYQFTIDLFRQQGVQILPGPCFWSNPPAWQPKPRFWVRISFAMDTAKLDDGLARFIAFAREYKGRCVKPA